MRIVLFFAALSAAAALCTATGRSVGPQPCFPSCRFSFCSGRDTFTLDRPDVAFTGPICRDGLVLGHVDETGEAFVSTRESVRRLTELGQGFTPNFFKSYGIRGTSMSGIGHEVLQREQASLFARTCVAVPLRRYQVLGRNGQVVGNEQGRDEMTDCVAFRVFGVTRAAFEKDAGKEGSIPTAGDDVASPANITSMADGSDMTDDTDDATAAGIEPAPTAASDMAGGAGTTSSADDATAIGDTPSPTVGAGMVDSTGMTDADDDAGFMRDMPTPTDGADMADNIGPTDTGDDAFVMGDTPAPTDGADMADSFGMADAGDDATVIGEMPAPTDGADMGAMTMPTPAPRVDPINDSAMPTDGEGNNRTAVSATQGSEPAAAGAPIVGVLPGVSMPIGGEGNSTTDVTATPGAEPAAEGGPTADGMTGLSMPTTVEGNNTTAMTSTPGAEPAAEGGLTAGGTAGVIPTPGTATADGSAAGGDNEMPVVTPTPGTEAVTGGSPTAGDMTDVIPTPDAEPVAVNGPTAGGRGGLATPGPRSYPKAS